TPPSFVWPAVFEGPMPSLISLVQRPIAIRCTLASGSREPVYDSCVPRADCRARAPGGSESEMSLLRSIGTLIVLASAVAVTSVYAADPTPAPSPTDMGMVRTTDTRLVIAYTLPGADFSRFRTIQLKPLSVPPDTTDTAPAGRSTRGRESFIL